MKKTNIGLLAIFVAMFTAIFLAWREIDTLEMEDIDFNYNRHSDYDETN